MSRSFVVSFTINGNLIPVKLNIYAIVIAPNRIILGGFISLFLLSIFVSVGLQLHGMVI